MAIPDRLTTVRRAAATGPESRERGFFMARVAATARLSRSMQRITLAASELAAFHAQGGDQFVRLLFPAPGQHRPVLPVTSDWWQELLALPADERPALRNYTVRRLRHDRAELDIDFVLHGSSGPGTRWAADARPGDRVGVLEQDRTHAPGPRSDDWQLLVGDETALPTIAAILEQHSTGARVDCFIEVPSSDDIQSLEHQPGAQVRWLPRDASHPPPGALAAHAVREAQLPPGPGYAWVAGEAGMTTAVRRHLVRDRGFDKGAVTFCGYWRHTDH